MAKNRRDRNNKIQQKRGFNITTNQRLLPRLKFPARLTPLSALEDNRRSSFHDRRIRSPFITLSGHAVKTVNKYALPSQLSVPTFKQQLPRDAVVCFRRQTRREVIFASGKGGGSHRRKYKRNDTSKIICKRR